MASFGNTVASCWQHFVRFNRPKIWTSDRGVFRGEPLCNAPPLGRQNCKIAEKRKQNWGMAAPLCKVGIRFDHTKGMLFVILFGFGRKIGLNLSEDLFLFFCSSPNFGRKIGLNLSEGLFFCSSPNFGRKIGLNLSGTISDSDLCSSQIFWRSWPPLFKILRTLLTSDLLLQKKALPLYHQLITGKIANSMK